MIPLRDDAPRTTTPFITYFLVALNLLIFVFEAGVPQRELSGLFLQFGVVPANVDASFAGGGPVSLAGAFLPFFTSMFLHGSWLHVISNMWALWIFGDNIEDHLGHARYLFLYLASGVAGGAVHVIFNHGSPVPSVGASGAIAGVMGAYFLLFPSARVLMLIPLFFFVWLPAWVVLGYWFVVQFLQGAATSIANPGGPVGIAFWAHVGGFIAGVTMIKLFPARAPHYYVE